MVTEHFEWLRLNCLNVTPCGSRVTCNPAPMDTDEDWLVQISQTCNEEQDRRYFVEVETWLYDHGYQLEGSEDYQDEPGMEFGSWRLGEVNLIVTHSERFATLHMLATKICMRLNLMHKADRIAVFEAIMYQEDVETSDRKERQKRLDEMKRCLTSKDILDPPQDMFEAYDSDCIPGN